MDLAYPIRGGYRIGADPLRWSLRTFAQHTRVDRVFIAGEDPPEWLDRSSIEWLEVPFTTHKRDHTGRILEAILSSEISDRFLWLNDDFFVLEDRDEWPLWVEPGSLRDKIARLPESRAGSPNGYVAGLRRQLELLEDWGFPDPPSLDLHTPLPIRKETMSQIYARGRLEAPELEAGFFRTLYYASGEPIEILKDPKIYQYHIPIPEGAGLVSTTPISWNVGLVGKALRDRYWRRSPWERP